MCALNQRQRLLLFAAVIVCGLTACGERPQLTSAIKQSNELRIATYTHANSRDASAPGTAGFEFDLIHHYARWLGVTPRFYLAGSERELRQLVDSRKVHMAAALLRVDSRPNEISGYGPTYAVSRYIVVHHRGQPWPRTKKELIGWRGVTLGEKELPNVVRSGLPKAKGYEWYIDRSANIETLMQRVNQGAIDYAVLPSFEFEELWRKYPELREGLSLGSPRAIAWYNQEDGSRSLFESQLEFFNELRESGAAAKIRDRHFAHVADFDYVESRALLRHYRSRFPQYRTAFITSGTQTGLDWRLLAALSYQESHWRNNARSPTGVRGLMMLTERTAKQLKVDRLKPKESILGGARYLRAMKDRLPERIQDPDRTWLALAAYNIGMGHLEDARVLTDAAGGDPDSWLNVRQYLTKLGNRRIAAQTKFGPARGYQAVHFVARVREYYEVLKRLEDQRDAGTSLRQARSRIELVSPAL